MIKTLFILLLASLALNLWLAYDLKLRNRASAKPMTAHGPTDESVPPHADRGEPADAVAQIQEMVDRETRAWDTQDVDLLMTLFHPDMVWPWPPGPQDHDPEDWELVLGRFDRERWSATYRDLFATYALVHNHRTTVKITVSEQGDGAFAVVDIDTLWRDAAGNDFHWKGRVGKGYTLVDGIWKLVMHSGALDYGVIHTGSDPSPPGAT